MSLVKNRPGINLYVDKFGKVRITEGFQIKFDNGYNSTNPMASEVSLYNSQLDYRVLVKIQEIDFSNYVIITKKQYKTSGDYCKLVGIFKSAHKNPKCRISFFAVV